MNIWITASVVLVALIVTNVVSYRLGKGTDWNLPESCDFVVPDGVNSNGIPNRIIVNLPSKEKMTIDLRRMKERGGVTIFAGEWPITRGDPMIRSLIVRPGACNQVVLDVESMRIPNQASQTIGSEASPQSGR